jgi:hypothetical protein
MIRRIAVTAALLLSLGTLATVAALPAHASGYTEICGTAAFTTCTDAWNDGPWVDVSGQNEGAYGDFVIKPEYGYCNSTDLTTANCGYAGVSAGHIVFQVEYIGGGPYNDECAGDAYNSSTNNSVSLDPCGGYGGSGAGWGSIFWGYAPNCPDGSGDSTYTDFHWHEFFGPSSLTNGANWNEEGDEVCLAQSLQYGVG